MIHRQVIVTIINAVAHYFWDLIKMKGHIMSKYSKEIYSKEVLLKAAFAFTDKMYIHLDADETYYIVKLTSKTGSDEEAMYSQFENELITQETRKVVAERTRFIREMIVARALSSTIINKEIEDKAEQDFKADEILTDWFDQNE